jgi:arsenate reductase
VVENRGSILVLCTGNSARSQMAEGLIRSAMGEHFEVSSAGTHPSHVRREAIEVMAELGIDISRHCSKSVDEFSGREIDYVLTVCDNARENCPFFPAKTKLIHVPFADPAIVDGTDAERLAAFRVVRDEIREFVRKELPLLLASPAQ